MRVHTRLKDIQSLGTEATESPFFQAYLRFLLRVEAQGDDAGQENLEPNEKALLELVVLRWAKHLVPGPQGYAYMETMGKHMIGVRRSIHISFTR